MINLIPKEEKKKMIVDFRYRLVVLFIATIDFCILIALVAALPSYFLVRVKSNLAASKLEAQSKEPMPAFDADTLTALQDLNKRLDIVENSEKNKFLPSLKVINSILLEKRSDIKIVQISYDNTPTLEKKINISGTAPSREVLLLFRQALEGNPNFQKVNLPVSNFVKGSNIQFYLTLTPA